MIPRAARRTFETALLTSRQALPRPARLYSTPTRKTSAPALASAAQATTTDFPFFPASPDPAYEFKYDLSTFLHRPASLTIVPPFCPDAQESLNAWYPDSRSVDMTGIIDACLHNLYDVPRAHQVFSLLRAKTGNHLLTTPLYNAFLEAYVGMAQKDTLQRAKWIQRTWRLYDVLELGTEGVLPNTKTYSIMLFLWHLLTTRALHLDGPIEGPTPGQFLSKMVERDIPVMSVISNPVIESPEVMSNIAKTLSSEAVKLGFKGILEQLGQRSDIAIFDDDVFTNVPEVLPVRKEVKTPSDQGKSEYAVPFNLEALRRNLSTVMEARKMLDKDLNGRQRHLESSVYDLALEQLQYRAKVFAEKGIDQDSHLRDSELQSWMWTWHTRLVARLKVEILRIGQSERHADKNIAPYVTLINPEKLSLLTILEIMRLQGSGGITLGMKTTRALISVGRGVENEYKAYMCKKHDIPLPQVGPNKPHFFSLAGYRHLRQIRLAAAASMEAGEVWSATWSQSTRSQVGAVLVECLMDVAQVTRMKVDPVTHELLTENQPAFFHAYEYVRGTKLGVLKLNPIVAERMAKDSLTRVIHPRHLPMLVKPKPWLSYNDGGYIYNKSFAMRFKDSVEQEVYLREATNAGSVELVYAGLDILGSTPWRINKSIFDVVVKVWNSGVRMGKLPPAMFDEPEPLLDPAKEYDMEERRDHIGSHRTWAQRKANNHSDRCSVNYKIEIARAFLGDTFYLPHNLDFRGRAYPIPPHLNHIGDDLSRGLLVFAEAKPLGERGLRWMKIHLANLYGYDKAMFDERVKWADDHMEQIVDSATNPLEGSRWWLDADDPWQCLATCVELKNAYDLEDPTTYVSPLPIHQDGTCNGLQHYAALGGDSRGAEQVNLAAGDRPSDVYTHVSMAVERQVAKDAEAGHEIAKLLLGKITRKVVKQTVMTTVYGVTFVGAREQIEKQLKDKRDIPHEKVWACSSYVAKKVLLSIGETFKGAKSIQTWLNVCARLISRSIPEERLQLTKDHRGEAVISLPKNRVKKEQMTSVIWTTPLGLPIVQPYRKAARKQVMTAIQSVYISDPNIPSEVNAVKQASAFPPNFIHSLDATHMMLTALECRNQNLTFASVHDSYWTHACDVDKMSGIIRETFIALHSSGVLTRLDKEFRERYKNYKVPLDSLLGSFGSLIKQLAAAGTRITAHKSDATLFKPLNAITDFTDEEVMTSITERSGTAMEEGQRVEGVAAEQPEKTLDEDTFLEALEGEETEPMVEIPTRRAAKAMAIAEEARLLTGRAVNLIDLIPPLPDKGSFEVESIKKSLYFFS